MSEAILLQFASGDCTALLEVSAAVHRDYCKRHGITFVAETKRLLTVPNPQWDKLAHILKALGELNDDAFLAWLDADTLIIDPSTDLRTALPAASDLGMVLSQGGAYNSGVIFMHNRPQVREFFQVCLERGLMHETPLADQARINTELSMNTAKLRFHRTEGRWNVFRWTKDDESLLKPIIVAWHAENKKFILDRMRELVRLNTPEE